MAANRPWSVESDSEPMVQCPVSGQWFIEVEVIYGDLRFLCPVCTDFHPLAFIGDFSENPAKSNHA